MLSLIIYQLSQFLKPNKKYGSKRGHWPRRGCGTRSLVIINNDILKKTRGQHIRRDFTHVREKYINFNLRLGLLKPNVPLVTLLFVFIPHHGSSTKDYTTNLVFIFLILKYFIKLKTCYKSYQQKYIFHLRVAYK